MNHITDITPESLSAKLTSQLDPVVPTFVLVDPMLGEPLPELVEAVNECADLDELNDMRSKVWQGAVFALVLDETIELEAHRHPYLVSVDPMTQALPNSARIAFEERARALAQGTAPYRIGGWLQSARDPQVLCGEIARLCRLRTQGGVARSARYLRMGDRRVLALLRHVLGEQSIGSRLPSLSQWLWLDDAGRLERLSRIEPTTDKALVIASVAWSRLALGTDIHPVRARWLGMAPDAHTDFDRVERALAHAGAMRTKWPARFQDSADRQAWALLYLLFGDLSGQPGIDALLRQGDPAHPEAPGEPAEAFHLLFDAAFDVAVRMRLDASRSPTLEENS
ncbi:hypothetical protein [Denitromonas ohlonensis]|uniref:DUF4123 domain-containing protein n=2 Tax=Denitromonas TaxID=139331 RepID=A0A557RTD7_9RHOO|nr:hypothetical protein [Denitromonas ohlonensis]TVO68405.1 hypothetical protein FHP90_03745 [Denitromonas ohlonensis]TVO74683.1 hypothetical protein FHP89_15295 [Denitromonas ohlonensis]